jgi:hypothetical protein
MAMRQMTAMIRIRFSETIVVALRSGSAASAKSDSD